MPCWHQTAPNRPPCLKIPTAEQTIAGLELYRSRKGKGTAHTSANALIHKKTSFGIAPKYSRQPSAHAQ